jgi:glycosyltransferase involved in cell wall biosynthesis
MYQEHGISVTYLGRNYASAIIKLMRKLRREHFDIIDMYGLRISLIGRILGKFTNHQHLVSSWRNMPSLHKGWQLWLDRISSHLIELYICNTQLCTKALQRVLHLPENKLKVLHNGIDLRKFYNVKRGTRRKERHVGNDKIVITCVANLKKVKAHTLLLDAFAELNQEFPMVELWLIGDGPERKNLEHQASALQITDRVVFWGTQNDIPQIMADSDIFVLASQSEGMSNAIMEAMASAVPVVATRVGGTIELIEHGKSGLLVNPGDTQSLSEALRQLCLSGEKRYSFGKAGRTRIQSQFKLIDKVHELEMIYSELA